MGIAYVFAVRRMAGGSVASGMRTQVRSKWTRWQGDEDEAGDEGVRTTVDVEDECTLVAIGSGGGRGADDLWGDEGGRVMGTVEGDEESSLAGGSGGGGGEGEGEGGEGSVPIIFLSSSYERRVGDETETNAG
jgi:hypothetical protein